jgi:DNA-binding IclR family transcriptional regulator
MSPAAATRDDRGATGRPVSVAGKIMAILAAFSPGDVRLTLTEICHRAHLPLATGHRLIRELTGGAFLEKLPDGSYRVGLRLWQIGAQAAGPRDLRELALPYLEDLYEATHENVQLAVWRAGRALYLERLHGPRSVPIVTRVGSELPLHATGVGKVLLAYAGDDAIDAALSEGLRALTPRTVTDTDTLRAELAEVRRTGLAFTDQEMTLGTRSIAAPIRAADGRVVAALSLTTRQRNAELHRLAPAVRTAARALSRDVAAHWHPSD